MQAVLLAGGLGTRLRSVVSDRPKPMALIDGRPFMEYVVRGLLKGGISHIVFAVGYKGGMVEEYFKDGSDLGFKAFYSYEEELLGTAGAIKQAGKQVTEPQLLVINGDTFYQMDYSRLNELKAEQGFDLALVLRQVPDVSRYGEAVFKDGRLAGFNEKSSESRPGTINGGVYLMDRALLDEIPDGKVSLEQEMIPRWMREGKSLGGMVNEGYFIDIGVPEDYYQFEKDVKEGVITW